MGPDAVDLPVVEWVIEQASGVRFAAAGRADEPAVDVGLLDSAEQPTDNQLAGA